MAQGSNPPNPVRDVIIVGSASGSPTIPVSVTPVQAAGTDRSAATGVASAQFMAANATRVGFFMKNDTAIDIWIAFGVAAVIGAAGAYKIAANGGYLESPAWGVCTSAINAIAVSGTPILCAREF